jgi:hypothetical protein
VRIAATPASVTASIPLSSVDRIRARSAPTASMVATVTEKS